MISAVLQADVCTQEGALRLFDIATGQPGGVQHVVASLGGLWKASISHLHCCVCPFGCQSVCPSTYSSSFHSSVHPQVHLYTPRPPTHIHSSVYLIHPPICFCTNLILPSAHPTHPIDSSSIHPLPPTELFYHPFVHPPFIHPRPSALHHPHTTYLQYLSTHPFSRPPIQTLVLPIHLFIQTPTLSIHSPTHTHPYMYPFIHPPHQFIYPTTPIQLLIHPSAPSIHLFAHPYQFVHPPTLSIH